MLFLEIIFGYIIPKNVLHILNSFKKSDERFVFKIRGIFSNNSISTQWQDTFVIVLKPENSVF